MKANELQIINFLQAPNIQFVIPVYQRNYDWTNTHCKRLLNDIISVVTEKRGSHFIGSIVFIHEGTFSTGEVKELVIIDGQQRLTTLSILYVALYRFAHNNKMTQESERIYNMFLTNQYVQHASNKLKLKQTDKNSNAFQAILDGIETNVDFYSNVVENFNFFNSEINKDNFETILNGLSRLIFVEISLERDKDNPQRIFESLNSTGLDLSQSDLIRNYILMDLPPREQKKTFVTVWNPIEENAKDYIKQTSLVSDYIRDYLTLRTKKIPNKSKVYAEFKNQYSNKKDESFLEELENIKSLSIHYKKFINPSLVADKSVKKELEYINRLEINVAYPFLLQVFEDKENGLLDQQTLVNILKLIQSYVWRRFVVGLPTNALNKIFMTLYSEVDQEEYYDSIAIALLKKKGSGKFPSDEDIKSALKDKDFYNTQPKNRNYLFEMLENFQNKEFVSTSNEDITIEHIFPRNPNNDWHNVLSQEEYFLFMEKHLNTIGNLTLSGNNGSLSNFSFSEKKNMNIDEKQQGYIYSRLWLNSFLKSIDEWNIENYNLRMELMTRRFLSIWPYPDIEIPISDGNAEHNIFDSDNPTFKKLEYFIFEDTKVEESAIAQMYFYVIEKLFEKNSQLLIGNQDYFKITRNTSDFRNPQEIVNGWFIESNIDNRTKFNILKKLLTLFELDEELTIKFQDESHNGKTPGRYLIRKDYWTQLLPLLQNTSLFTNVNPSKDHWLSSGAGISGISYAFVITKSYIRLEVSISSSNKEKNKKYFNDLKKHKDEIENSFGSALEWEELPDNKMSRVKYTLKNVSLFNEDDWPKMNQFFIENLPKFEQAFQSFIQQLK